MEETSRNPGGISSQCVEGLPLADTRGTERKIRRTAAGGTIDGFRGRAPRLWKFGQLDAEIVSQLGRFPRLAVALAISALVYGFGHAATALVVALLGQDLAQRAGGRPLLYQAPDVSILVLCFFGLMAALVKTGAGTVWVRNEARLGGAVAVSLRTRFTARLLREGADRPALSLIASISVRVREVETAVGSGFLAGARAVAQLVPLALALIAVSPLVTLGAVAVLVPFGVLLSRLRATWRRTSERSQQLAEELVTGVDELVRNADLWRTYGASDRVLAALGRAGEQATTAQVRADSIRASLSGFNEVLGALAVLGAVYVVQRSGLGSGQASLVATSAVLLMAYRPLRDLGDASGFRTRGELAFRALDASARPDERRAIAPAQPGRGEFAGRAPATLSVRAFGARERGPRIDFTVEPGRLVAITGPTGAGKTTILRAMLGLEPCGGSLVYGERDLVPASVGPHGRPFAWVPQDAPLVTGTIVDNVAVALLGGDPARAIAALDALGAGRLTQLADVVVGPGGRTLSGGERRHVSLARALASELPVLLLDEPTEGLDAASERDVLDVLRRLKGRRSMVVVSHRPGVAELADEVVELGAFGSELSEKPRVVLEQ